MRPFSENEPDSKKQRQRSKLLTFRWLHLKTSQIQSGSFRRNTCFQAPSSPHKQLAPCQPYPCQRRIHLFASRLLAFRSAPSAFRLSKCLRTALTIPLSPYRVQPNVSINDMRITSPPQKEQTRGCSVMKPALEAQNWARLRVSCMMNPSRVMETQFRTEDQRRAALTESEKKTILGIDPSFHGITQATYFDNYDLPCPIRVEVETKENKSKVVVLRKTRHGNVEEEARMFRALKEYGLPVPEILSGPFRNEEGDDVAIYSLLEGENLQKLSMRSEDDLQEAKRLLVEADR